MIKTISSLLMIVAALLGLVLGVTVNLVVASWFAVAELGAGIVAGMLSHSLGFVTGMVCFGFGLAIVSRRSLWRDAERKFFSRPRLQMLTASLMAGFGFGTVYFYAFFQY